MAESTSVKINCPLCGATEHSIIKIFPNGVTVGRCASCNCMYTPQRHITPDGLFAGEDLDQLKFLYDPIINGKHEHFRDRTFRSYLKLIQRYGSCKKHLDVGCAHGFFPRISQESGNTVTGVEPGPGMAKFGKNVLGLDIREGVLSKVDLGNEQWEMITFTDSLEYFADPVTDLSKLVDKNLKNSGLVFIKVPNGDYFNFRHWVQTKLKLGKGNQDAFSPSMRVMHFDNKSLPLLAEKIGLRKVKLNYFKPINSPDWIQHTGLWLEMKGPWWMNWRSKLVRSTLHKLGKLEYALLRKNHFSQSIYIIGKKP